MKPEELARYERMYQEMQQLLQTKALRFHFPGSKTRLIFTNGRDRIRKEGSGGDPPVCKPSVWSL